MYKVALVDDEPLIRTGLARLIDWEALRCSVVFQGEDGEETLAWLQENPADILLCDIQMPGLDGLELAERLYESGSKIKIIFLTAFSEFSYVQKALHYHAVDYVVKSSYIEKLPAIIQKTVGMLDQERQERERLQALQQQLEQQNTLQQSQLLHIILNGAAGTPGEMDRAIEQNGLRFPCYYVACFTLSDEKFQGAVTAESAITSLQNFIRLAYKEDICFPLTSRMEVTTVIAPKSDGSALKEVELAKRAQDIIKTMREAMGLRLNAGISSRQTDLTQLAAVKEAVCARMDDAVFYQRSEVVWGEEKASASNGKEEIYKLIQQHLDGFPSEQSHEQLEAILSACWTVALPAFKAREIAIDIVSAYHRKLAKEPSPGKEMERHMRYGDLHQTVTLTQLLERLTQTADDYAQMLAMGQTHYSPLINKVVQYIQLHFRESINLTTIAQTFHMNKSYLGNLYKKGNR